MSARTTFERTTLARTTLGWATLAAGWPLILGALGALSIPSACLRSTEVRYYTLASKAPADPPLSGTPRYAVHVAPALVPETLDRPELVLRVSATELAIDDRHLWAEPLRTGIARAVAERLGRQLDGALVSASEQRAAPGDVEVTIDVQDFDVRLAEGAAIDVAWTIRWAKDGRIRTGRSAGRARSVGGGSHDAAVAACAVALDSVSDDIARSVRLDYLSGR
jgi:uncharacterized lipoprotein YmbA